MTDRFGHFAHPKGYDMTKVRDEPYLCFFTKAIYEVDWRPINPCVFHHPDGWRIRPVVDYYETDMGTIPLTLQPFIPKDRYLLSFLFHDCGCTFGEFRVAEMGEEHFKKVEFTRKETDDLLPLMVGAEGGSVCARQTIHKFVRAFALATGKK